MGVKGFGQGCQLESNRQNPDLEFAFSNVSTLITQCVQQTWTLQVQAVVKSFSCCLEIYPGDELPDYIILFER